MDHSMWIEVERSRKRMHEILDQKFDNFILHTACGDLAEYLDKDTYAKPLLAPARMFKGAKPTAVILPEKGKVVAATWQRVVLTILLDCDSDPVKHERLMTLRSRVAGDFRWLLSDKSKGLRAPLRINEGLYFEGKFDTEALLRNLTKKILEPVGYDYSGIAVLLRNV
ncbi:hypothetical protein [Flavonifractor sp. An100]|uniref:hypothetical protein n=1 Tax=Flavonifractor sp. An100 TaxID=1965538 RepID=UPI000B3818E6|nr:hypothetical protein [Flavonifractor sp. An100]OUQ77472.1 hypothetical protein B5E43_10190 [Flavonifractor sp. An100]